MAKLRDAVVERELAGAGAGGTARDRGALKSLPAVAVLEAKVHA
jgi:hypothetical protein